MDINAMSSMQQMRKMDGTGGGQENGGAGKAMREMMQQLPEEQRASIQEQMQGLDPTQRKDMVSQIAQLDTSDMSVDDLTASILDLLSPETEEEPTTSSSFSIYA